MHTRVRDQKGGGEGGMPNYHTRSQGGKGGVQNGPKTDHEILEQYNIQTVLLRNYYSENTILTQLFG